MKNPIYTSSPWGFRFLELQEYCAALKNLGVDRLCFMTGPADGFPQALKGGSRNVSRICDVLAANGVAALECAMVLDGPDDDVALIAGIGAPYLRICEVWEHTPEALKTVAAKLHRLGKMAADKGLTVIVENHGGLMATSDDCRRLLEAVGRPNVKLNYDAANFLHYGGEDALAALRNVRDLLAFTHLKSVTEPGFGNGTFCRIREGIINYAPILRELNTFYRGPLGVEYEKPEDVIDGTRDDLESLRKWETGQ